MGVSKSKLYFVLNGADESPRDLELVVVPAAVEQDAPDPCPVEVHRDHLTGKTLSREERIHSQAELMVLTGEPRDAQGRRQPLRPHEGKLSIPPFIAGPAAPERRPRRFGA